MLLLLIAIAAANWSQHFQTHALVIIQIRYRKLHIMYRCLVKDHSIRNDLIKGQEEEEGERLQLFEIRTVHLKVLTDHLSSHPLAGNPRV